MDALKIENLSKTYATGTHALNDVSLTIPAGDFFALLGPNGAGKTSLIGVAVGLVRKTAGNVLVGGFNIDTDSEKARTLIGLVPQEINFNPFEKPIDIVVNQAGYYGIPRHIALPRANELLDDLGLGDKKMQKAMTLSGGYEAQAYDCPRADSFAEVFDFG